MPQSFPPKFSVIKRNEAKKKKKNSKNEGKKKLKSIGKDEENKKTQHIFCGKSASKKNGGKTMSRLSVTWSPRK